MEVTTGAPAVIEKWKRSAARQGVWAAWILAKSYHSSLDVDILWKGFLQRHENGLPFTDEDRKAIVVQVQKYAARTVDFVNTDVFFPATDYPDNT